MIHEGITRHVLSVGFMVVFDIDFTNYLGKEKVVAKQYIDVHSAKSVYEFLKLSYI